MVKGIIFLKIKIMNLVTTRFCLFIITLGLAVKVPAQPTKLSRYGVPVVKTYKAYLKTVEADSGKRMLDLLEYVPGLRLDLRYAGRNNFMGRRMYPSGTRHTYLRAAAVKALIKVQQALKEQGLGLLVWDAFRPYRVTVDFWELVKDERYVADPSKGSNHNRGLAIDCTLYDLSSGRELNMGTGFDNFTDTAHHAFIQLPDSVLRNRKLLRDTMTRFGFQPFDTEWWHYSWSDGKQYEVLDLAFRDLKKKL